MYGDRPAVLQPMCQPCNCNVLHTTSGDAAARSPLGAGPGETAYSASLVCGPQMPSTCGHRTVPVSQPGHRDLNAEHVPLPVHQAIEARLPQCRRRGARGHQCRLRLGSTDSVCAGRVRRRKGSSMQGPSMDAPRMDAHFGNYCQVHGGTSTRTPRPALDWKLRTAVSVAGPKSPSAAPGLKPLDASRFCRLVTHWPAHAPP